MKKVLMCTRMPHDNSYVGGVVSIVQSYLDNSVLFNENGYEVEVFSYEPAKWLKRMPSKIANILYIFLQRIAFTKRMRYGDVSIVNIHTSREFLFLKDVLLAKYAKRKFGTPTVLTVHVGDSSTVFNKITLFRSALIRILNSNVDKIIFLTETIKNEFSSLGLDITKTEVLYNFHNLKPCNENKEKASGLYLIYIGAIHREKGILDLLNALVDLPDTDFHIDVCGKLTDQSIKKDFMQLIERLNDKAELCGYVRGSLKTQLLERADILILPSYHEGMPLVILEALATGCAIISTRVGGTPEILSDDNVKWVEIADPAAIKNAVLSFVADNKMLNKMKNNNRNLGKEYTLETNIWKLCEVFNKI